MSRVWRDGQKQTVYIYRFLCTATIDEKIQQRQIRKQELSLSVMSDADSVVRNFDTKSLKEVFTYRDDTNCETRDILAKTKKQQDDADDEVMHALGDYHDDLKNALDPLLQSVPANLISAFQNRVSSLEENRRALEMMAARAQKKLDRAAAKAAGKGAAEAEANGLDDDDDDGEEVAESDEANSAAAASSSNAAAEENEDDGEMEYDFSVPRVASSSNAAAATPYDSNITAEDEAAAAEMNEDEDELPPQICFPMKSTKNGKGQKRRRSISDEDEDEDEDEEKDGAEETRETVTPPMAQPTPAAAKEEGLEFDWMKPHTPTRTTSAASSRSSPLDTAACAIVPPDEPALVEMEYTLDSIDSKAKPKVKKQKRTVDEDEEWA
jgi:hypothetical protein